MNDGQHVKTPKKDKPEFFCRYCQLICENEQALVNHKNGHQHKMTKSLKKALESARNENQHKLTKSLKKALESSKNDNALRRSPRNVKFQLPEQDQNDKTNQKVGENRNEVNGTNGKSKFLMRKNHRQDYTRMATGQHRKGFYCSIYTM